YHDSEGLCALAKEFPQAIVALVCKENSGGLSALDQKQVFYGKEGLLRAIGECDADIAVNGIAGSAGLEPSLAVLENRIDLALANKESVVMAWELVHHKAQEKQAKIIPVDSEHSAVFSLINQYTKSGSSVKNESLSEIILTASGGPFRTFSNEELRHVDVERALAHPTWNMGRKITIDSASLANKGLEVIEAVRLFDVSPDKVSVVIHPQSIVHSMIRLCNGALYAELSKPDMRLPIHKALYYPEVRACPFARLDFDRPSSSPLGLSFEAPCFERFPMLRLAYDAVRAGPLYSIAYNAANEIAVSAFLNKQIDFLAISRITEQVLSRDWSGKADSLDIILDLDKKARSLALKEIR
ncbi:MAG: 1-deoxy-D-xylulose-5-phosphate reductoisomerase, partial [Spirochaetaceae bacterium]|nr:1-deoxy-D-xylulose-5-phosphate reductoisomerase [Spirochaetaceae bacterium]